MRSPYGGDFKMNHLVTVVGYDDDYPKENFTRILKNGKTDGSTPPANGAFIVKNSWGSLTDVNGDGELTIQDATCIQKFLAMFNDGSGSTGAIIPIEKE